MITEEKIESAVERLDAGDRNPEEFLKKLKEECPRLLSYLNGEWMPVLFPLERETLVFGLSVLYETAKIDEVELSDCRPDNISDREEANWGRYNLKTADFHERLNPFFEGYEEEDLLAFVEDLLIETEEAALTDEGRDVVFIALKTMIDEWYIEG